MYLLAVIRLPPCGSSTVHIYTHTIRRTTQLTTLIGRRLFHAGQAHRLAGRQEDRQTENEETNGCFSQFFESA
jgi:hypothetical protein